MNKEEIEYKIPEQVPIEVSIEEYVKRVESYHIARFKEDLPTLIPSKYSFTKGSKYFKVIEERNGGGKSVFCFIDYAGNLYKAATFSVPAKGIRGNIFQSKQLFELGQFYRI